MYFKYKELISKVIDGTIEKNLHAVCGSTLRRLPGKQPLKNVLQANAEENFKTPGRTFEMSAEVI